MCSINEKPSSPKQDAPPAPIVKQESAPAIIDAVFEPVEQLRGMCGSCENCLKNHDGKFGSGRFCSIQCSRSFAHRHKSLYDGTEVSLKKNKLPPVQSVVKKNTNLVCEKCHRIHEGRFGSGRFCSIFCARSFAHSKCRVAMAVKNSDQSPSETRGVNKQHQPEDNPNLKYENAQCTGDNTALSILSHAANSKLEKLNLRKSRFLPIRLTSVVKTQSTVVKTSPRPVKRKPRRGRPPKGISKSPNPKIKRKVETELTNFGVVIKIVDESIRKALYPGTMVQVRRGSKYGWYDAKVLKSEDSKSLCLLSFESGDTDWYDYAQNELRLVREIGGMIVEKC